MLSIALLTFCLSQTFLGKILQKEVLFPGLLKHKEIEVSFREIDFTAYLIEKWVLRNLGERNYIVPKNYMVMAYLYNYMVVNGF